MSGKKNSKLKPEVISLLLGYRLPDFLETVLYKIIFGIV